MGGGEFAEFITIFINRYIFLKSKQCRFIIPFTIEQIKSRNKSELLKQILVLKRMFSGDLTSIVKSIQPIITKAKKGHEDTDIDILRSDFEESFKEEIDMIKDEEQKKIYKEFYG